MNRKQYDFPSPRIFAVRFLRAVSIGAMLWWSYEMCSFAASSSVDSPFLSSDRSDYASVPGIASWVVVACASSIIDEILYSWSITIPLLQRIRMTGLVIAYAWSAATLPTFDHTYRKNHAGLVGLGVQTASVALAMLDSSIARGEEKTGEDPRGSTADTGSKRITSRRFAAEGLRI